MMNGKHLKDIFRFSDRVKENSGFMALFKGASILVDKLSGALCYMTVDTENIEAIEISIKENDEADEDAKDLKTTKPPYWNEMIDLAKTVSEAFENNDKLVHLRLFSDVIRELRRSSHTALNLPKGHTKRLGKVADHFIWDIEINKDVQLRNWLIWLFNEHREIYTYFDWRTFCEAFGQALYLEAKEKTPEQFSSKRPVGASPGIEVKTPEHNPGTSNQGFKYEWLITGDLISETPFFFGWSTDDNEREQTNLKVLVAKDGHLRFPRSALRGILRRDLKIAFDNTCRAELALKHPCSCPVCNLMKKITIKESLSDNYINPPEIRHRIRIDPKTGTVAKGALFDMEVGPKGVKFPFELRVRSAEKEISKELKTVLSWWTQGIVSFSGDAGTGKGRFCLKNLKYAQWDLKNDACFEDYKETFGGRKKAVQELTEFKVSAENSYHWEIEEFELSVCSPFITKDPINSLIDPGGHDAICYTTTCIDENGKEKKLYLLKGESLRGILRTAIGRRKNLLTKEHEDCNCTLCRIFGNEHEAGKIRIEDFIVQGKPESKVLDRVAIDRFTAGARDKFKFDATPLVGTPEKPLVFKGVIWSHKNLDKEASEALKQAWTDIQNGLYPLGGLGNIGFGWVKYLDNKSEHLNRINPEVFYLLGNREKSFDPTKIYFPHYFFSLNSNVLREKTPPSHACIDDSGYSEQGKELYSGKIVCTLETQTPLIIPDTSDPKKDENGHEYYEFFSLNEELCIPGSEIKGMISSVYEALTNSCLRIFDEKKRLSWRMEAEHQNVLKNYYPGRITNNCKKIEKFHDMARIPFYDNHQQHFDNFNEKQLSGQEIVSLWVKIWHWSISLVDPKENKKERSAKKWRKTLKAEAVFKEQTDELYCFQVEIKDKKKTEKRCIWLKPDELDEEVIQNLTKEQEEAKIDCWIGKSRIQKAILNKPIKDRDPDGWEKKEGYLHIVGPSKIEFSDKISQNINEFIQKGGALDEPIADWKAVRTNAYKDDSKKTEPTLYCKDDNYYYTMGKYCEMFFFDLNQKDSYDIPESTLLKYKELWNSYTNNPQSVPLKIFQSRIARDKDDSKNLKNGYFVYFREDKEKGEVVEIVPVRISRTVDDHVLAEKLSDNLRPCVREILDDKAAQKIKKEGLKEIFQHHPDGLCPACSLFGTTFYKGRVSFGFAFPKDGTPELANEGRHITLPLLERPRPTWSMPSKEDHVPGKNFMFIIRAGKRLLMIQIQVKQSRLRITALLRR